MGVSVEQKNGIFKKVLSNGLVVLVRPVSTVPKVSMQLCYHVGSKDEGSGEKGMAHLIEHMIFKGTPTLSETDIAALTQKLSGSTNAFTKYDYTAYLFDFPSQYWKEALAIYTDSMRNARFDQQMLNSELKAVIQELKMRRDNYFSALWQALMSSMFVDHPYHYPIIGFKQDLWSLKRDDLFAFYKKHYVPNNAVLVVVGDVNVEEVVAEAEKTLGKIPADPSYKRKEFYLGKDLVGQELVLRRDLQQPYGLVSFVVPGARSNQRMLIEVISALLGNRKSSRLTKKLVDDLRLTTSFSSFPMVLEDATLFCFGFSLKDEKDGEAVLDVIKKEIADIIENGVTAEEVAVALKQVKTTSLTILETNLAQATIIGETYLTAGNEHERFDMLEYENPCLADDIRKFLKEYFSPAVMHFGKVLPLTDSDKEAWKQLQELSDEEDARILNGRIRDLPVEATRYADTVSLREARDFHFPQPQAYTLSNGVRVFECSTDNVPKIELILSLNAQPHWDSEQFPGLYQFVCFILREGTKNYPGTSFAKALDDAAITLQASPGSIVMRCLKEDFVKALGLLKEMLTAAAFEESAIEKTRELMLSELRYLADDAGVVAMQKTKELFFEGHPYSKKIMGTEESIRAITKKELQDFYETHLHVRNARIAIVGDLRGYDVKCLLEETFASLPARSATGPLFPALAEIPAQEIKHHMNRDQVVLVLAGQSIHRAHPDYSKLALFDRILAGSMDSRLFKLRQRTGIFYSIGGSLVADSDEQPGLVLISTMVSLDRLEEAKAIIRETLTSVVDDITEQELETAKRAILASRLNSYSSDMAMAVTILTLDRFSLGQDYYDKLPARLAAITLDQVKEAAKKVLQPEKMVTLQVGRFE